MCDACAPGTVLRMAARGGLTAEQRGDLLAGLRTGATVSVACLFAGVEPEVFEKYLARAQRDFKAKKKTDAAAFAEAYEAIQTPSARDSYARKRLAWQSGTRTLELSRELTTF